MVKFRYQSSIAKDSYDGDGLNSKLRLKLKLSYKITKNLDVFKCFYI